MYTATRNAYYNQTFRCCTSELKHYHLISSAQSSLGTTEQNNALYEHRNIPVDT